MFSSIPHPEAPKGESDDKHEQIRADKALADTLASMPAGLEVVPADDKHFHHTAKETVQALPEAISQDGEDVLEI
jgi:hypothetical protein